MASPQCFAQVCIGSRLSACVKELRALLGVAAVLAVTRDAAPCRAVSRSDCLHFCRALFASFDASAAAPRSFPAAGSEGPSSVPVARMATFSGALRVSVATLGSASSAPVRSWTPSFAYTPSVNVGVE
ncbi:MAG: hypothetical protein D6744_02145 [Planctomycetota bacterium]|nr:MAG: hypothetical protein D6744_02145 [Planctomycetota bacterium]